MSDHSSDTDPLLPGSDAIPENSRIIVLEEGIEIQHTKAYGIGIDCHSRFIQISVLVKRDLRVFEYRREFSTSWNSLSEACEWSKAIIKNCSSPPVDESAPFHYCIESTSTYFYLSPPGHSGLGRGSKHRKSIHCRFHKT